MQYMIYQELWIKVVLLVNKIQLYMCMYNSNEKALNNECFFLGAYLLVFLLFIVELCHFYCK